MNQMLSKKEKFKQLVESTDFFVCPICKSNLIIKNESLVCENNHTFNINKKGFACLLKKQKDFSNNIDTKELFINMRKVILSNLYQAMHQEIVKFISADKKSKLNILDVGSGESTHSYLINQNLNKQINFVVSDLSKQSIELSTDYLSDGLIPIVCDAYNLPLKYNSIDYILDILSPYYHKEINRVLKMMAILLRFFQNVNILINCVN